MAEEDNIFMRAAFGGKLVSPTTSSSWPSTSTSQHTLTTPNIKKKIKGPKPRKPNAPHRKYSTIEDQLILQALQTRGRDYRAILGFMKSHWEVLGDSGKLYRDCNTSDKSVQQRLRKRVATLLAKQNNKIDEASKIEDEFRTVDEMLQTADGDEREGDESWDDNSDGEINSVMAKLNERDKKYMLDAAAEKASEPVSASGVMENIKLRSRKDKEEHGGKKRKTTKASKKSTKGVETKLEGLLDQLPNFLATANAAAAAHTKALRKWQEKLELDSSSDTE